MTRVTCMLTAKNRYQLRNPPLGNRLWAAFTFYNINCPVAYYRLNIKHDVQHRARWDWLGLYIKVVIFESIILYGGLQVM